MRGEWAPAAAAKRRSPRSPVSGDVSLQFSKNARPSCRFPRSSRPVSGPSRAGPRLPRRVPRRERIVFEGKRAAKDTIGSVPPPSRRFAAAKRDRHEGERDVPSRFYHAHPLKRRIPSGERDANGGEPRIPSSLRHVSWKKRGATSRERGRKGPREA